MKTPRQRKREAHQLWRACLADGALDDERTRMVVDQMLASNRSEAAAVLKLFVRLVRLDREAHTAVVASAQPLAPPVRAEIEQAVAHQHRATATQFVVDPALIAGVRVQIGSDVYDGSVRGALTTLESRLEK